MPPAPRVLLANEAGGGRGHVTTLRAAALALGPGLPLVAGLGRMTYANVLADMCEKVLQAPRLTRMPGSSADPDLSGNVTWGDTLAALGLADETVVRRGLRWWRDVIVDEDISILIADFAPLAVWAAQGLAEEGWAIRTVTLGTGYSAPPSGLERFPFYFYDFGGVLYQESETLALLNRVCEAEGLSPLPTLASLYRADLELAATFPFLDPYADLRPAGGRISPLTQVATPGSVGDEVFVYFSTRELEDEALVHALESLPLPRRGYLPSATPEVRARLVASGMILTDGPVAPDDIARRSRLMVHAAPHGSICMAALAGLAQIGVPQHLEQLFHARRAAAAGILRIVPRGGMLGEVIGDAYTDSAFVAHARSFAADLRRGHPGDPLATLAARLAPEVAAAIRA